MGIFGRAMQQAQNAERGKQLAGSNDKSDKQLNGISVLLDNEAMKWASVGDEYHTAQHVDDHVVALINVLEKHGYQIKTSRENNPSDRGVMSRLYDARVRLFIELVRVASDAGMECGWSRKHNDGELCFGGGWVIGWVAMPNGKQARYHMEDTRPLPPMLEKEIGSPWNGKEETLDALLSLAAHD